MGGITTRKMALKQKAFRLYPEGYTGNSLGELNSLLASGWLIKITLIETRIDTNGSRYDFNVLIMEKDE
jgi:hypothetical protein